MTALAAILLGANIEDKSEVVEIDARAQRVTRPIIPGSFVVLRLGR
jgi:hypothetical protein